MSFFSPIQIVLIVLSLLIALLSARTFKNRLLYRLIFLLGLCVAVMFIVYPGLTSQLAQLLSVGRGVDLVFYVLFAVVTFAIVLLYRRILKLDEVITAISRRDAIRNATKLDKADAQLPASNS